MAAFVMLVATCAGQDRCEAAWWATIAPAGRYDGEVYVQIEMRTL